MADQLLGWQRASVQAAAIYLRERIAAGDAEARTKSIYDGLLEVLDPPRRAARIQREAAAAAQAATTVKQARERRLKQERRAGDRRRIDVGSPTGHERRAGRERRSGRDRRLR